MFYETFLPIRHVANKNPGHWGHGICVIVCKDNFVEEKAEINAK